ncbi:Uncharacterized protein FWK35_00017492 [Aphis craccivora]|uniref:Uncharacterized protein n=1 Tax=Aphis craccivora TaxID=307492 RepID=A0A6G0Y2L0_APHCR|nr:Uncharacterized protein FWK35_00017492 [Aphis craccivora]
MVNKTSMVVISGAISNSLDQFKIRNLEGRPLLLPLNKEARPMGKTELLVAVKEIKRVFRIKTDKNFYIQFEKLNNREIIFEVDIGTYNKSGRLLNLVETHNIMCKKNHHTTYAHDPRMDVKYIKCIFDYVIRKQRYENLIKHF